MLRTIGSPMFVETTPYNILWNLTDPILTYAQKISPELVPYLNIALLSRVSIPVKNITTTIWEKK